MIKYYKTKRGKLIKFEHKVVNSWVQVVDPTEQEIEYLVSEFGIEKDYLIDGLDIYETPRVDENNKIIYIYLRVPTNKGESPTSSFLIILAQKYVFTISKENLEIFEKIIESKRPINTSSKLNFVMRFLSLVSIFFSAHVRKIMKEVKRDRSKLANLKEKDILSLILKEDILNDYLSSFSPLVGMHKDLMKIKTLKFSEANKEFIGDLVIDLEQTYKTCKSALRSISNMRDYYSVTLSNDLNKIITILTIFTIFLTIPTLVSGIYGMNIFLPLQKLNYAFWIIMGIIVLIWIIMLILLRKLRII